LGMDLHNWADKYIIDSILIIFFKSWELL
jgi:hypothetical protein